MHYYLPNNEIVKETDYYLNFWCIFVIFLLSRTHIYSNTTTVKRIYSRTQVYIFLFPSLFHVSLVIMPILCLYILYILYKEKVRLTNDPLFPSSRSFKLKKWIQGRLSLRIRLWMYSTNKCFSHHTLNNWLAAHCCCVVEWFEAYYIDWAE